jgi:hypothetical protein
MSNKSITNPININGNISYKGNMKHGKFWEISYSFVSLYFYTVNLDEDIAPESFSLKINLRSLW